jgi:hypothetical protein
MALTAFPTRQTVYQKTDQAPSEGKSLIVRPTPDGTASARPHAAFLAQLIAKTEDMPVSRTRRRADPAEGAQAYRAIANLSRPNESRKLRVI